MLTVSFGISRRVCALLGAQKPQDNSSHLPMQMRLRQVLPADASPIPASDHNKKDCRDHKTIAAALRR